MTKTVDCVVYMVPLENGLTQAEWGKIISFFPYEEELIPIEAYENNTAMIGLLKNDYYDEKEQISKEFSVICEDWSKEPDRGELNLIIKDREIRTKILCDYSTVILGENDSLQLGE